MRQKIELKPIDDDEVLSSYYDNRETFVVNFNPYLVNIKVSKGIVIFSLKHKVKK